MANRFHTYFGQIITQVELNEIHDALFAGVDRFVQDFGYNGIAAGGDVTEHTPNNLSVDVGAPAIVYDQFANRVQFGSPVVVPCNVDENGAPTTVIHSGYEKWLSIFVQYVSTPSDPRTDDLGNTVYFQDVESFKLNVVQGAEAPSGTAVKSSLRGDQILLADVKLAFGATAIHNADVSTLRTQTIFEVEGTPLAFKAKSLADALQAMTDSINDAIASIDSGVAGITVDTLAVPTLSDSPISISAGTLHVVLTALLTAINDQTAILSRANTFTAAPQNVNVTDNGAPLFGTTISSLDDPAVPGNGWKLIFQCAADHTRNYRVYTGGNDTSGMWVVTCNAFWHKSDSHWRPDTTASDSMALFSWHEQLVLSRQAAGAGSWSAWPTDKGDVVIGGNYLYAAPKPRTTYFPIINGATLGLVNPSNGDTGTDATPNSVPFPFVFPAGAIINNIEIAHHDNSAGRSSFQIFQHVVDWTTPGVSTMNPVGPNITAAVGSGNKITVIPFSGYAFDPTVEYQLWWTPASISDTLQGIRAVSWTDAGPTNG